MFSLSNATRLLALIVILSMVVAFSLAALGLAASVADPVQPHLAQAWTASSKGDGLPGQTGVESYIYDDCEHGKTSEHCLHAHIWDYGADTCIKIEVDAGFKSHFYSGSYYIKCDSVDCCCEGDHDIPDVKKWDIGKPSLLNKVAYLGLKDTTELNDKPVKGAEAWHTSFHLPFTKAAHVDYTYYVTHNTTGNSTDVITHRIDYSVPGTKVKAGSILYGDFKVQHDLAAFRKKFYPPAQCTGPRVMSCNSEKVKEWNKK